MVVQTWNYDNPVHGGLGIVRNMTTLVRRARDDASEHSSAHVTTDTHNARTCVYSRSRTL